MLIPKQGSAQARLVPTPPPAVTASSADWQIAGEPLFYMGTFYFPTGPTVFFDGNVMARTGVYRGVPLYQDTTMTPYSVVFIPLSNKLMRPYERRPADEVVGTTGLRTPGAPGASAMVGTIGVYTPSIRKALDAAPKAMSGTARSGRPPVSEIWIDFNGARWVAAGDAEPFDSRRFVPAGSYRGVPVYRAKDGGDEVYVTVVANGPVAPFRKK